MFTFFHAHPLALPLLMFVTNMAISNMPDPDNTSGKAYKYLYALLHGIIGGIGNVIYAAKPAAQLPTPITTAGGTYTSAQALAHIPIQPMIDSSPIKSHE